MSFFSTKYFVRSHLLLAVLGSFSLFSLESHGMDSDPELDDGEIYSAQFLSVPQSRRKNTDFEKKVRDTFKSLSNLERILPEHREALEFFEKMIPHQQHLSAIQWITAMFVLIEAGDEKQKTQAYSALLEAIEKKIYKGLFQYRISMKLMDTSGLLREHRQRLQNILKTLFDDPELPIGERFSLASFFYEQEEDGQRYSSFLLENAKNPTFSGVTDRLKAVGKVIHKQGLSPNVETALMFIVAEGLKNDWSFRECKETLEEIFKKMPNGQQYITSLFLQIAENSDPSLFSGENSETSLSSNALRVKAALEAFWSVDKDQKMRASSILRLRVEDPSTLLKERLEILNRMAFSSFDEKGCFGFVYDALSSILVDSNSTLTLKDELEIANRLTWSRDEKYRKMFGSFFLDRSRRLGVAQKEVLEALYYVANSGTKEHIQEAFLELERISNSLELVSKDRVDILRRIISSCKNELQEKAGSALLSLSERENIPLRRSFLQTVASHGTQAHKTTACEHLLRLPEEGRGGVQEYLNALDIIISNGTEDQKKKACGEIWIVLETGDVDFETRLRGLKMIAYCKSLDEDMRAVSAMGDLAATSPEISSLENRVNLMCDIMSRRFPDYDQSACAVLLTLLRSNYQTMTKATFEQIKKQIQWRGTPDQKAEVTAILLLQMENTEGLSFKERVEKFSSLLGSGNDESQNRVFKNLMGLLRKSERSYEECKEILNILPWNLQEDQQRALNDSLFFVFQTSQALSEVDRIDLAQRILWSKRKNQKIAAEAFLIFVLQRSNLLLPECLEIAKAIEIAREEQTGGMTTEEQTEKEIEQKHSEQVCQVLYSFYEKSESEDRLSIVRYIMRNGTLHQKEQMGHSLMSERKNPDLSSENLQEIERFIQCNGTLKQREDFLLDLFGKPNVSFEIWEKWYDSFWKDYKFDPLMNGYEQIAPQEEMRETLLKVIENPASSLSLEYRKSAAFMLTSFISSYVRSHTNTSRAYAVLWSIFENSDCSVESRRSLCKEINSTWHAPDEYRVKAASYLMMLLNEETRDLSDRIKIAKSLVENLGNADAHPFRRLEELHEQAGAFLLPLMKEAPMGLSVRKELAFFLLGDSFNRGVNAKQKEDVCTFLGGLIEDDTSGLSPEECINFSRKINMYGNSKQKESACTYILKLIEDDQSALSDRVRRELSEDVNKYGAPAQKRRAGILLLKKTPSDENGIRSYLSSLREVLQKGTSETKEDAGEKLLFLAQDPQITPQHQKDALRIVAECGSEKQRERACDLLRALSEKDDIQFMSRIYLLKSVFNYGLPLQKEAACTLLLELSAQSSECFTSLSSRLELIRELFWYGSTPDLKEKASALWLALLKDGTLWPSFKERFDSMHNFNQNASKAEHLEEVISLLVSLAADPLLWDTNLKDRLSALDSVFYKGTEVQKEAAYSILLTIAQSTDLSFAVRIDQANKVLWKGTEAQKRMAFDVLCALSDGSDISSKDRLKVAGCLMGDDSNHGPKTPQHQAERACTLLLSLLQDDRSTFSQKERLDFAERVVSKGSREQKGKGISFVFSIIKDSRGEIELDDQIKPLISTLVWGTPEDGRKASDLLVSVFENPDLSVDACKRVINDVYWSSRSENNESFALGVQMIQRLLVSIQNFENSLSMEKRFAVAEQLIENYSRGYSQYNSHAPRTPEQAAAADALLTIMEQPEASLGERKRISMGMQSYYKGIRPSDRTEVQQNRAWRVLWGVLIDPQILEDDFRDTALFLIQYSRGREMPQGAGKILLPLMSDPDVLKASPDPRLMHLDGKLKEEREREGLLSAHRQIAFFLLQYGESDDQKERAGDFLNTSLLNDERLISDTVFSHDWLNSLVFKILLHATPTQKERAGTYLLSLIGNDRLSLEGRINTAVLLMNDCVSQQREIVAGVLQTILTPEMLEHVKGFIQRTEGIVINMFRIREEPLSQTTKELLLSTLLSYAADNTSLSADQRREVLQFVLYSRFQTRDQLIQAHILLGNVPAAQRTLLQGILGVFWTDLRTVSNEGLHQMITTLGTQPSTDWQRTIEQMIERFRPQEVRPVAGARYVAPTRRSMPRELDERYEVHQFSSVGASNVGTPMTQHEAVMNIIENDLLRRETSPVAVLRFVEAFQEVNNWIETNYPRSRHPSARHSIQAGMDMPGAKECVASIVSWLKRLHPQKIDVWMRGFVGESLTAYEDADSCKPGVAERAIAGLRGIDDRIDALFEGATKMQSAKAFISGLNFRDERNGLNNKAWLVQKFIELGVTAEMPESDAARLFKEFGRSLIEKIGLDKHNVRRDLCESFYLEQLDVFVQTIEDYYEADFKNNIVQALQVRVLAATAAGSSAMEAASAESSPSSEKAGEE